MKWQDYIGIWELSAWVVSRCGATHWTLKKYAVGMNVHLVARTWAKWLAWRNPEYNVHVRGKSPMGADVWLAGVDEDCKDP